MTDEEYLRNRLDRLNQNSHYGIMIDTEITDIVRRHIKRLEETKMNATSVQTIENVKEMHLTTEKSSMDKITKVIVGASTNDDIFEFHLSGEGCTVFVDQWFKMVADKAYKADFESERNKRQMMERENNLLREKIKNLEHADRLDREARDGWSEEYYKLSKKFDKLQEENENLKKHVQLQIDNNTDILKRNDELREEISRCNKVNEELGNDAVELEKRMQMYKQSQTQKIKALKKELALEKAANEAQHKFIREYAGKGTEVQFNYAIDDAKEVSYVVVEKNGELAEENKQLKQENSELKYMLNDIKFTKDLTEMCLNTRAGILDQAKKCVCGQREQDYGTPESNFQLIADLWNDYLKKEQLSIVVDAKDVAMMMALMKIARIKNGGGSGDSFVDLAGYAACGGEIWALQKETN